jgi:hypothetical protein
MMLAQHLRLQLLLQHRAAVAATAMQRKLDCTSSCSNCCSSRARPAQQPMVLQLATVMVQLGVLVTAAAAAAAVALVVAQLGLAVLGQ